MSWKDALGEAWDTVRDKTGATIGGAWSLAQRYWDFSTSPAPGYNPNSQLGKAQTAVADTLFGGIAKVADLAGDAISYGISRPISSIYQMAATGDFSAEAAVQGYKRAEQVSPGQAFAIGTRADVNLRSHGINPDDPFGDPTAIKSWMEGDWAKNTWSGKLQSGSADFFLSWYADPFAVGGKAAKVASESSRTLRGAEETRNALRASEGITAGLTGREQRLGKKIDTFLRRTDGMSASDIALQPELRATADGGALAYFFARANEVENVNDRLPLKRTLWGATLGDADSIAKLEAKHARLADELAKMNQVPAQARFIAEANGDIRLIGQEVARVNADQATLAEIEGQRKLISDELAQLTRVLDARGTSSLVKGSARQQAMTNSAIGSIRMSYIGTGLGARRHRVVAGSLGARLPGHVSVKDPTVGFDQLRETLTQAAFLRPEVREQLLNDYVKAGTAGDRIGVVARAEAHIVRSVGEQYGLSAEETRKLLANGNVRRDAYRNLLKSRLYSASDADDSVTLLDPEDDEFYTIARPLLKSQIEEHAPIIDPRMLDKVVKFGTQNRILDKAFRGNALGDAVVDGLDRTVDVSADLLTKATRLWKDSALFRLAYPMRVQVDSQLRLASYMGVLPYMAQLPTVMKTMGKFLVEGADWEKSASGKGFFKAFKPEFQDQAAREVLSKLTRRNMPDGFAMTDEEMDILVRRLLERDGGIADIAGELADHQLAAARANGNWGYVHADDPRWGEAYVRAVNQQIRNSPTAMALVNGADPATIRNLVARDDAMRAEWGELSNLYDNDLDSWVAALQQHVDHYLPTAELRDVVSRRQFTPVDVKRHFGGSNIQPGKPFEGRGDRTSRSNTPLITKGPGADGDVGGGQRLRMTVHGEAYSPTKVGDFEKWYQNTRKGWYSWASSAPENIMARSPLYAYAYRSHLSEIVNRLSDNTYIDMDKARRAADKLARRDVGQVLFDTSHASNMSHTFRFVSPFFAAWEDMAKKWSALIYERPWVAERFRQAWEAPNNMGLVVDSNGNRVDADGGVWNKDPNGRWYKLDPEKDKLLFGKGEYLVVPAPFLSDTTGAGQLRFNKKAFNIVFQGEPWWLPGAGPLVQVPVNELVRRSFPEAADNPALRYLLPYGVNDRSIPSQLLPSWVRQTQSAVFGNSKDYAETYTLLLAQETAREKRGERGEIKPGEIERMTRNWYIMRAFIANASPVSAMPSPKLAFYQEQAHLYRQKFGEKWQEQFYADFPDYYSMTISLNTNETGIQATDNSWRALRDSKIRQRISENPEYGWALLGADAYVRPDLEGGAYDPNVATALNTAQYGYGNTDTFRGKKSPAEALADIQRQQGWLRYQKIMTVINMELEKRGLHSLSQRGAEDLKFARDGFVQYLGSENSTWLQDYTDGTEKRLPGFFATMAKAKEGNAQFANRSDIKQLDRYIAIRREVKKILAERDTKDINHPDNKDLRGALDAFGAQLSAEDFGFEQMWNRMLSRDDLKGDY